MEVLKQAVALVQNPDPGALMILAAQELEFGNPEDARQTAERALKANPHIDEGHSLIARSLMALGRFDEAEKRWQLAISLEPRSAALPLQRGIAFVRHGQFDKGIEAMNALLARNPNFVPALVQIASAKRLSDEDRPLIVRMEEVLQDNGIGEESQIALRYALGKAYDNLKEFEPAMAHFDVANALQYQVIETTGGFDRDGYTANMALRMHVYAKEIAEKLAPAGNPSAMPIFVLGVIRSGTTLAEQILSSHPLVAGAGELGYWINADLRLMDYEKQTLNVDTLRQAAEP